LNRNVFDNRPVTLFSSSGIIVTRVQVIYFKILNKMVHKIQKILIRETNELKYGFLKSSVKITYRDGYWIRINLELGHKDKEMVSYIENELLKLKTN